MKKQDQKRRKGFPVVLVPVIIAVALYLNTLPNEYCLDDYCVINNNSYVKSGLSAAPEILTTNFFNGFNGFNDGLYRPVPILTYALEYEMAGLDAGLRHLVNALLYALIAFFIFRFLKQLTGSTSDLLPLVITLLYIAHPVHTEAVANIKGRDEVLAFLFSLMALFFLLRYADGKRPGSLFAGLAAFSLGLLSKENSVMFLIVIPGTLLMFRKPGLRILVTVIVPLVLITAGWLLWREYVIRSMTRPVDTGIFSALNNSILSTDDPVMRIATGLYLQVLYILKLVIPWPLSHDYSFNQIPVISFLSLKGILALLVILSAGGVVFLWYRKEKLLVYGILFYFLTILTVANLFLYIGATFAERFLFTPSFGFSIVSGVLLLKLVRKAPDNRNIPAILSGNKGFTIGFAGLLAVYAILTIIRNSDWKDNLTLYSADVTHSPNSARVRYNYGTALYENARDRAGDPGAIHDLGLAEGELRKAVAIFPSYQDAWNNLGNVHSLLGRSDSAIRCYLQTIRLDSNYRKGYFNTGIVYLNLKDYRKATGYFRRYLDGVPDDPYALYLTGNAYGYLGDFDSALVYLERSIALEPENKEALILAGKAYGITGQYDRSLDAFQKVIVLDPANTEARQNIAITEQMMQSGKK